jgi:hypothetical protein
MKIEKLKFDKMNEEKIKDQVKITQFVRAAG